MYVLLLVALLAGAAWLAFQRTRARRIAGCALATLTLGFFAMLSIWGDALWFEAVGYASRFWRMVAIRSSVGVFGVVFSTLPVAWLLRPLARRPPALRVWPEVAAACVGLVWGAVVWKEVVLFFAGATTAISDPVLGRPTSFYLFTLPLLDRLLALALAPIAISAVGGLVLIATERAERGTRVLASVAGLAGFWVASALAIVAYHLLYSQWGVVSGPGWTDVYVRLPALRAAALLAALLAIATLVPGLRKRLPAPRGLRSSVPRPFAGLAAWWGGAAGAAVVFVLAVPLALQWLVVLPNEISFERPFIAHNIAFTRSGFGLEGVEVRRFPASDAPIRETLAENQDVLREVRLWDPRALDAVYKQFQEIRLYYEFPDVDIDRYRLGDRYRQVMISARELAHRNLPTQSQTFVNRRFKYTHGYGVTVAPAHDFTSDGLPDLLVKDLPPRSAAPELAVERPEIYYGELTTQPAVVRTLEPEFDHPSGDENVYTRYEGTGGVPLENLWRKFVFGWKFDGTPFLLSNYPREEARVMLYRDIVRRAKVLAPFLRFDRDPYVVVAGGRLYWILDAYTASSYYPYSEPFSGSEVIESRDGASGRRIRDVAASALRGVNYVRNSVKIVIDAYEGTTRFYVFDPEDPLVAAWQRVFPGLFQAASDMPDNLRVHVRYPETYLLAQGLVYAKYHMTDAEVFYNQEDLWVRATEKYRASVEPVRPYYVMWKPQGSAEPEFVLILPFTPKNKQVLIGWIAGLCDGDNYGRFIAYKFPKEKRVLGPQQVETKIDQDPVLSARLTLWDQRGSQVIRGNMLALPVGESLLYVEPIYIQAETAAYPELRLVVAMHGDRMSYGSSFDEAIASLTADRRGALPAVGAGPPSASAAARAREAFDRYLRALGDGEFRAAGEALEALRRALDDLPGAQNES